MASSIKEIAIAEKRLKEILDISNEWAVSNGVTFKAGIEGEENGKVVHTPYALFPSPVPGAIFDQARSSMTEFSRLLHKVANDHNFLTDCLGNVIDVDPFMNGLWNIYLKVKDAGVKQPLMLGIFRNDFMMSFKESYHSGKIVNSDDLKLKHIEINVISASFAGLAQQLSKLHRLTLDLCGKGHSAKEIPENKPASGIAKGLLRAWKLYNNPQAVIVFLVSGKENNTVDQRWIEFKVYEENPRVQILRRSFIDFHERGSLNSENKLLMLGKQHFHVIF